MDIVFNADDNYAPHLCVAILSVIEQNRAEKLHFHVLSCNFSDDNRLYVEQLVLEKGSLVSFYCVDSKRLRNAPIGGGTANPNLSYAAYLRLLIPEILPCAIKKVLYLDCDIVVVDDIFPLWNTDIKDAYLASLDDFGDGAFTNARRLGFEKGYKYFNSGVMLLNLEKLRALEFCQKAQEYILKHFDTIIFHDQDVLNALLYRSRLPLEERWNTMYQTEKYEGLAIVHFAGIKPWTIECKHPLRGEYRRLLNQTKWANMRLKHHFSLRDRLVHWVKRVLSFSATS